jgi:cytochrome d ubiquinol oxidase subunit II
MDSTVELIILVVVALGALVVGANLGDRRRGFVFPGLGCCDGRHLARRAQRCDGVPFAMTVLFFVTSFLTLAVLFWPYMIPYRVTVADAAALDKSLSFLFWGAGVFVLPVIAIYTAVVYWAFRAKWRHA